MLLAHTHTRMHKHTHMYTRMHTRMHLHTSHAHIHTHVHNARVISMPTCTHVRMHACMHTRTMHARRHAGMQAAHICTHTHTHMHTPFTFVLICSSFFYSSPVLLLCTIPHMLYHHLSLSLSLCPPLDMVLFNVFCLCYFCQNVCDGCGSATTATLATAVQRHIMALTISFNMEDILTASTPKFRCC